MTKTYELPKVGCLGSRRVVAEFDENGIAKITEQALDSLICELNEYAERQTEPKWIPVSERLPEKTGLHLVSIGDLVTTANFDGHNFRTQGMIRFIPDAWMPLPKPYEPQEREK